MKPLIFPGSYDTNNKLAYSYIASRRTPPYQQDYFKVTATIGAQELDMPHYYSRWVAQVHKLDFYRYEPQKKSAINTNEPDLYCVIIGPLNGSDLGNVERGRTTSDETIRYISSYDNVKHWVSKFNQLNI